MSKNLYDDVVSTPRRTMVLFFIIDTSGSMSGSKIGTLNTAIEEIIPELKDISENNADAEIKIATLSFSTGARWITNKPISAENFRWDFVDAGGVTDLGEACIQLNEKLSIKEFMSDVSGSFAPAIFLMSDGEPTDNYIYGLNKLKNNRWFQKSIKVALAIGDSANQHVLSDFTGSMESVITVHSTEALKKWIQFVSVRASEVASQSAGITSPSPSSSENATLTKQDIFIKEIQNQQATAEAADWDDFDDAGW